MEPMNAWIDRWYQEHAPEADALMRDLWEHPETGLLEFYAAEKCAEFMEKQGFAVKKISADHFGKDGARPNAVVAAWGAGKPVVAILGELDALPGLGQECVPYPSPKEGPGHGCGHNLMAGGAAGAACALKYAMEKEGLAGTVMLVECPAEELGVGKGYLIKDGVFDGVDIAMMWHPFQMPMRYDAFKGRDVYHLLFEFFGKTAHAAGAPWDGKSALDAVQLMNLGCEFYREHKRPDTHIHFIISDGGKAPNIVPDYASCRYFLRAMDGAIAEMNERVREIAEGAAMMTGTSVKVTSLGGIQAMVPNVALSRHVYESSLKVPECSYTPEEYEYAKSIYRNFTGKEPDDDMEKLLPTRDAPFSEEIWPLGLCTDAGDVSRVVPSVHFLGGGRCMGTPSHNWCVTALSGMSIGFKTANRAYKVIAQAGYDALAKPEMIDAAWKEFHKRNPEKYVPMLPETDKRIP